MIEYATQLREEKIDGVVVTVYKKFDDTLVFGFKGDFLIDVSGTVDYSDLKKVFSSIEVGPK